MPRPLHRQTLPPFIGPISLVLILAMTLSGCGRTIVWPTDQPPGTEICVNGVDDDGDGLVDCDDPDCATAPNCTGQPEDCDNGLDDDGDGFIDCQDPDCKDDPGCSSTPENCVNGLDDDGDGLIDCNDPECFNFPGCLTNPEICDNGLDDDGDGLVDCNDPQCFGDPSCLTNPEICDNGLDDDGDGLVDCKDPQCFNDPSCKTDPEICNNGQDDDGDGKVDCDDPDCASDPFCKTKKENCSNKKDDDGDGLVDCKDPDCFKHPDCKIPGQEICNNGLDDDEDGKVDCDDSDCSSLPICKPGKENCTNGKDDDGDGAVDCDDPDCSKDPACQGTICKPSVDFGVLQPKGSSSTKTITTTGTKDIYTSGCSLPGGGEVVATFQLTGKTDLGLEYTQIDGDHVFALFRAGIGEPCNANQEGCFDPESAKSGSFSIKALDAGTYYLIVEAFAQTLEGKVTVTLSTGQTTNEICDNGKDDDGDLAVDCADLDCAFHPACKNQLCKVDVNLGTLVVNGPGKSATVDTNTAGNVYDLVCAAGGGGDRVIRFVMPTSAVLGVTIYQNGWHAFGVHRDMGPGTKCDADKGDCLQKQWPGMVVDWGTLEKGVYYFIVDAMKSGSGGQVTITLKAHMNRGPELCANNLDDDGDGLVDCMDPDCTGVLGCPGPVCVADYKTGPLVPNGPSASVNINTKAQNNDQTVSCALGGGKDAVVELDLPQVTDLKVDCTQTGDHVLGFFAQGQPRDPCDANPLGCADPKTGPIGCGFYWGNIQPGKYYIVVEAFKPGSEGVFNLTLQATTGFVQEICNNGKDDDGDGKIDCQDYNCATKPICQGQTCTPEQKLGLLPAAGTPVNVSAVTQGAGDSNSPGCAQGGGEDYVVGFTLSSPATLKIDYAQFGNHVFAIYENKGIGYACDAAPIDCKPSNNQSMGAVQFAGLKSGEYYLVVEAVSAGSEGSVVMQLAAK